jgi:hypothetical protein
MDDTTQNGTRACRAAGKEHPELRRFLRLLMKRSQRAARVLETRQDEAIASS